jgi:hypothetical protein
VHDVGYLVVYVSWACGLLAVIGALWSLGQRDQPETGRRAAEAAPSAGWRVVAGTALVVLLGSLALPWISGPAAGTGAELVLSGWSGLDVLSALAIAVLTVAAGLFLLRPSAGGEHHQLLLRTMAVSLLGLVAGNALIQATQAGGSRLAWGAAVSLASAAVAAGAAEVASRR